MLVNRVQCAIRIIKSHAPADTRRLSLAALMHVHTNKDVEIWSTHTGSLIAGGL